MFAICDAPSCHRNRAGTDRVKAQSFALHEGYGTSLPDPKPLDWRTPQRSGGERMAAHASPRGDDKRPGHRPQPTHLVRSLIGAIEAKDTYTHGHSERVAMVAVELGRELRITNSELDDI